MLKLIGNLEQEVMNILWEQGKALKPAEVLEILGDGHAYTTVMTIMTRLHKKGVLDRQKDGNAYKYSPKLTKDEFANQNLNNVYRNIIDAYGSLAISHFIQAVESDPEHRHLLKQFLKDQDET